jgi:beta-N-acetylhexosaminidase
MFGCAGRRLDASERAFFRAADPAGFILFARNVDSPAQVRALIEDLRDSIGRPDALVLIDQEGGRVARLGPPHWRAAPAAGRFGTLAGRDVKLGRRAAWLNARLLADELSALGITVDCLPVLDLRVPGAHDIVGDRSYGADADTVSVLGGAACEGLIEGGVLPVLKHIPGHGRAMVDSHHELPVVAVDREALDASDFEPFRRLAGMPLAMTAHIVYEAIDPVRPATTSATVIGEIIRESIGFDGLLMTDDLSMKALGGRFSDRTAAALAAGCDVALHCSGNRDEMEQVAAAARPLDERGLQRYQRAVATIRAPEPFDQDAAQAELADLLGRIEGA